MFQVVAHGLQSAYRACSVCAEREREGLLFVFCFFADGTKDDNPLWSPYQLLTCSDDSKHTAQHSVTLSLQSSNEMLKFSKQSLIIDLDHDDAVLCICNLTNYY